MGGYSSGSYAQNRLIKRETSRNGFYKKVPEEIPTISSEARSFNVRMAEVDRENSYESNSGRYQQEEPLQYRLERQDNQIGNQLGMLMELKKKLKNALEKRNVEKESARSDEGLAKGVVPEHKMEPFHTRQSDECSRGSQNLEGKAVASKAKVQAEVYRIMAEVVGITPLKENPIQNGWRTYSFPRNTGDRTYLPSTDTGWRCNIYGTSP